MEVAVERTRRRRFLNPNGEGGGGGTEAVEQTSGDDQSTDDEAPAPAPAGNENRAATGEGGGRGRADRANPPEDDVCPICFGDFTVPCKSLCGHWYCASCILTYWSYSATPSPCKCPMCSSKIHRLIPQESLLRLQDEEVAKVLREVQRYNLLFVGGFRGAVQKFREVPLCIKRYLQRFVNRAINPDRAMPITEMRLGMTFLAILYRNSPLQWIPSGGIDVQHMYHITFALLVILRLVGIFRSYLRERRAREQADAQPREA